MSRAIPLPPDERRDQLLDASRRVFARLGYHRAGVADIVAEAKVARGTFYRHFDSKRGAFSAVVEGLMAEVVAVVEPIDIAAPIRPQVQANLAHLIRAVAAHDVVRVLFTEAAGVDAEGDQALADFYGEAHRRIATALQTGQALGVVEAGDTDLLARCLLGLIKEPVLQAHLHGEPLDAGRLVETISALLSRGLLR